MSANAALIIGIVLLIVVGVGAYFQITNAKKTKARDEANGIQGSKVNRVSYIVVYVFGFLLGILFIIASFGMR